MDSRGGADPCRCRRRRRRPRRGAGPRDAPRRRGPRPLGPAWFAARELAERAELSLPPTVRMAQLVGSRHALQDALQRSDLPADIERLGPSRSAPARLPLDEQQVPDAEPERWSGRRAGEDRCRSCCVRRWTRARCSRPPCPRCGRCAAPARSAAVTVRTTPPTAWAEPRGRQDRRPFGGDGPLLEAFAGGVLPHPQSRHRRAARARSDRPVTAWAGLPGKGRRPVRPVNVSPARWSRAPPCARGRCRPCSPCNPLDPDHGHYTALVVVAGLFADDPALEVLAPHSRSAETEH